ncbi:hypothetical protein [Streptomyces sp. NBC_01615]|uniref:hypothetical protein n=1 Tax=Streptomyces sp. NBC_01615 TaxID=2975898 RepID=UPI0038674548
MEGPVRRVDDAVALLPATPTWESSGSETTAAVLPYLLALGGRTAAHRDWPHTVLYTLIARRPGKDGDDKGEVLVAEALLEQLSAPPPSAADRDRWLDLAYDHVDRTVRRILDNKDRGAYARAARLAAALTETQLIARQDGAYLDGILATYTRHRSFRSEADTVRRGSVLL